MQASECLATMRTACLADLSRDPGNAGPVRVGFRAELDRFFDALEQSFLDGDLSRLDLILESWVSAPDPDKCTPGVDGAVRTLQAIFATILEQARVCLQAEDALQLAAKIFPVYSHVLEYGLSLRTSGRIAGLERDLRAARASAAKLERSKVDFVNIAAHELRTPLTLIEGYAAMLQELPQSGPQVTKTILGLINGARRLRHLVDDLIDVSLIENGLLVLYYQPGWVHQILEIISADLASQLRARRQSLKLVGFSGWDEMYYFDGERVYQALTEVILNAIKYTPDGGRIVVSGRTLPGLVEIIVQDNGIGIDAENYNHIFEKFGRLGNADLHSSGKSKFKGGGAGLGLTIARGIFEAHGGSIWAESRGQDEENLPGATFHLLLPMRKGPPGLAQHQAATAADCTENTIPAITYKE